MTSGTPLRVGVVGRWRVVAVVLALLGLVLMVIWGARAAQTSEGKSSGTTSSADTRGQISGTAVPDVTPGANDAAALPPVRPVFLSIPSIDVMTRVSRLGLRADGSVQVPSNPDLAGWFRLGPPPGRPGSSVILGHVDSVTGPAVFARLDELGPGDRVAFSLDDGTTELFVVHSVRTYANADFPARLVYGRHGRVEVNLVTCGGVYDADRGGYQSNVVVNARQI